MFQIEYADRIHNLPPYLFAEIDRLKKECIASGADLIDLGVGDPDMPTPDVIVEIMREAVRNPVYHQYPSYRGEGFFRQDAARYMKQRFNLDLDPEKEVLATVGSKEGIANLPYLLINPGDIALVPEPCYPVLPTIVKFLGGQVHWLPLRVENQFLPDLKAIPEDVRQKAKILYLNYPNNPTGATATEDFLIEAVEFALSNNLVIAYDNAYSEVLFGDNPRSILQIPGARKCVIEFHSLSKLFNMTGWRIGFVAGAPEIIQGYGKVKTNIDSGAFGAVQETAGKALTEHLDLLQPILDVYAKRRTMIREALDSAGLEYYKSEGTFYVWVRTPQGLDSKTFAADLMRNQHIVATPGSGFGPSGEGWIRFSLTAPTERIEAAAKRLREMKI